MEEDFADLYETFKNVRTGIQLLNGKLKKLEKKMNSKVKHYEKTISKSKKKRAPSGFAKPSKISPTLCQFLGKPLGSQVARTEVTKQVIAYIKEKKLQDETDKQKINPDTQLQKLLDPSLEDLSYFTLQKHMNRHFSN